MLLIKLAYADRPVRSLIMSMWDSYLIITLEPAETMASRSV